MFGFLIKKTFFDMWDNLFRIIILNLGFLIAVAVPLLLPSLFLSISFITGTVAEIIVWMVVVIGLALLMVYAGAAGALTKGVSDYEQPGFRDFAGFIKQTYVSSLLFALVNTVYLFFLTNAFRFYGNLKSILGPLAVSLLFWVTVAWVLSSQYFFPVQARLDRKFRKITRKMLLLFFDNPGFSIGLLIGSVMIVVVSVFTAFLLPGISTLFLWWNVALKLRMYKYDYLEKNPGANRRKIPWDALLVEDRERVGKRTIKGMIFPWKE